jgi:hypothetical protein
MDALRAGEDAEFLASLAAATGCQGHALRILASSRASALAPATLGPHRVPVGAVVACCAATSEAWIALLNHDTSGALELLPAAAVIPFTGIHAVATRAVTSSTDDVASVGETRHIRDEAAVGLQHSGETLEVATRVVQWRVSYTALANLTVGFALAVVEVIKQRPAERRQRVSKVPAAAFESTAALRLCFVENIRAALRGRSTEDGAHRSAEADAANCAAVIEATSVALAQRGSAPAMPAAIAFVQLRGSDQQLAGQPLRATPALLPKKRLLVVCQGSFFVMNVKTGAGNASQHARDGPAPTDVPGRTHGNGAGLRVALADVRHLVLDADHATAAAVVLCDPRRRPGGDDAASPHSLSIDLVFDSASSRNAFAEALVDCCPHALTIEVARRAVRAADAAVYLPKNCIVDVSATHALHHEKLPRSVTPARATPSRAAAAALWHLVTDHTDVFLYSVSTALEAGGSAVPGRTVAVAVSDALLSAADDALRLRCVVAATVLVARLRGTSPVHVRRHWNVVGAEPSMASPMKGAALAVELLRHFARRPLAVAVREALTPQQPAAGSAPPVSVRVEFDAVAERLVAAPLPRPIFNLVAALRPAAGCEDEAAVERAADAVHLVVLASTHMIGKLLRGDAKVNSAPEPPDVWRPEADAAGAHGWAAIAAWVRGAAAVARAAPAGDGIAFAEVTPFGLSARSDAQLPASHPVAVLWAVTHPWLVNAIPAVLDTPLFAGRAAAVDRLIGRCAAGSGEASHSTVDAGVQTDDALWTASADGVAQAAQLRAQRYFLDAATKQQSGAAAGHAFSSALFDESQSASPPSSPGSAAPPGVAPVSQTALKAQADAVAALSAELAAARSAVAARDELLAERAALVDELGRSSAALRQEVAALRVAAAAAETEQVAAVRWALESAVDGAVVTELAARERVMVSETQMRFALLTQLTQFAMSQARRY